MISGSVSNALGAVKLRLILLERSVYSTPVQVGPVLLRHFKCFDAVLIFYSMELFQPVPKLRGPLFTGAHCGVHCGAHRGLEFHIKTHKVTLHSSFLCGKKKDV